MIAKKALPGQFVIVRLRDRRERIPLSLADIDPVAGKISLIVMAGGKNTSKMVNLKAGDSILDLCGPLSNPTEIEHAQKVALGGGFGTAPLYPIARAVQGPADLRERDIQGLRPVIVATDDDSKGVKSFVTTALKNEIDQQDAHLAIAIGPRVMMRAVAETTRPMGIRTVMSLNPIMVDGTGRCGECRVTVGGETKFACTDGPEFDGHQVGWVILTNRQQKCHPEQKTSFG